MQLGAELKGSQEPCCGRVAPKSFEILAEIQMIECLNSRALNRLSIGDVGGVEVSSDPARRRDCGSARWRVLVDRLDMTGKTTLAHALVSALGDRGYPAVRHRGLLSCTKESSSASTAVPPDARPPAASRHHPPRRGPGPAMTTAEQRGGLTLAPWDSGWIRAGTVARACSPATAP